jgi:hypothetical protein
MARQQNEAIYQHAGQTAVWRKYVSASAGNPVLGLGSASYYAERWITAQFYGVPGQGFSLPDNQTFAGMVTQGSFAVSTREELGQQDELVWRGDTYRIESDTVPTRIGGSNIYAIKRGS